MSDATANPELPPGTPLQVETGPDTYPLEAIGTLDPRQAAAEILSAFLRCAVFKRGGGDVADAEFALKRVLPEWPDPKEPMAYPSASIVDNADVPYEEHSLVPTMLEDTRDVFCENTVLWKTGEAVAEFQTDYWTTDKPTREAIAARIPSLFNPSEGRIGVVLAGEPRYFRRTVRATLLDHRRMDTEKNVFERERRLFTLVRCEIDVVQLRKAVTLQPRMVLRDGDPEGC